MKNVSKILLYNFVNIFFRNYSIVFVSFFFCCFKKVCIITTFYNRYLILDAAFSIFFTSLLFDIIYDLKVNHFFYNIFFINKKKIRFFIYYIFYILSKNKIYYIHMNKFIKLIWINSSIIYIISHINVYKYIYILNILNIILKSPFEHMNFA